MGEWCSTVMERKDFGEGMEIQWYKPNLKASCKQWKGRCKCECECECKCETVRQ